MQSIKQQQGQVATLDSQDPEQLPRSTGPKLISPTKARLLQRHPRQGAEAEADDGLFLDQEEPAAEDEGAAQLAAEEGGEYLGAGDVDMYGGDEGGFDVGMADAEDDADAAAEAAAIKGKVKTTSM
jgi:hypothetical protein